MENKEIIALAQRIVGGSYINFNKTYDFMNASSVYRITNENMTSYYEHLKGKKKILTVIGSGDQILNSILAGSREIDCFDITVFAEYHLFLKMASIMALSEEEYKEYFFSNNREVLFSDDLYSKVRERLNGKYREFWDGLYNYFDGIEIGESLLFRQDFYTKKMAVSYNPYLQGDNYNKLKSILLNEGIKIKTSVLDITKTKFDDKYDLINLSNILSYYLKKEEYKKYFQDNFRLNENGEIINYVYDMSDENVKYFNDEFGEEGYIESFDDNKLMVYKGR